jgi:hypothetical protein
MRRGEPVLSLIVGLQLGKDFTQSRTGKPEQDATEREKTVKGLFIRGKETHRQGIRWEEVPWEVHEGVGCRRIAASHEPQRVKVTVAPTNSVIPLHQPIYVLHKLTVVIDKRIQVDYLSSLVAMRERENRSRVASPPGEGVKKPLSL